MSHPFPAVVDLKGGLGLVVPTLSFYTLGALPPLLEKGCRVPCVLIAVGVSGLGINANQAAHLFAVVSQSRST